MTKHGRDLWFSRSCRVPSILFLHMAMSTTSPPTTTQGGARESHLNVLEASSHSWQGIGEITAKSHSKYLGSLPNTWEGRTFEGPPWARFWGESPTYFSSVEYAVA